MSFLLRRNLPWAWGGWYDSFEEYGVSPLQWPWVHLGDGTPADFNNLGELHIRQNPTTTNGGGESYEFMPFTPNWGFEAEFFWPAGGASAQAFDFLFTNTWADIGAAFVNCAGIRFYYRTSPLSQNIYIAEYPSIMGIGTLLSTFVPPSPVNNTTVTFRMWIDDDQWCRLWFNGTYMGSATIESGFKFGPGRRCLRIFNNSLSDAYIRWIYHYDRIGSFPADTAWTQIFYDNFNGRSGNQNGVNGWTQIGTNAGVASDSWATNGTTDGSRGLIRNTGITNGRMRITATVGGAAGINGTADSSLVLCSNSAGTQALCANIFNSKIYISDLSSSIGGSSPTFTDQTSKTSGVTVNTGDVVGFTVYDGLCYIDINGSRTLYSGAANATTPASNSYAGLRVERASFNDSNSWNDVTIYSA
jgi:hypothetical protein